jgi:predicted ATPase
MKANGREIKVPTEPAVTQSMTLQTCHKPLKSNPYISLRDETGRWIIIRPSAELQKSC